jgi:5-methylthioribose kinase
MTNRDDMIRQHPEFPWLSLDDRRCLESFLRQRGWLAADERVSRCEKPGDGNMNLTLRVITDQRTLIVKQARPWVEKYDHIPAPWDRAEYEHRFYERIQSIPDVATRMPQLLFADMAARVLVLEDLGDAQPLTSLYAGEAITVTDLQQLAGYLRSLHEATRGPADPGFANIEMRQLNHQHIFEIPLANDNGIELDQLEPGLSIAAAKLRDDSAYLQLIRNTGDRYLSTGPVLLHGDYFPGSWLRAHDEIFVIDPEFCFYGDPEFDLACAMAHLCLAQQPRRYAVSFLNAYTDGQGDTEIESSLLASYAAAEVMRRLIGVAQLPLRASDGQRAAMLERSHRTMLSQTWEELWV